MPDEIAKKTAEDFRRIAGEGVPEAAPVHNTDTSSDALAAGSSSIEASIERVVRAALQSQLAERGGRSASDPRLEALVERLTGREDEVLFALRNVIPGLIEQKFEQAQATASHRLDRLEEAIEFLRPRQHRMEAMLKGLAFAIAAGIILAGLLIFERPLRNWGQDTLFPLLGVAISEAPAVRATERRAPPLGTR
jgi:hypothetical protein